jgi:DNA-binding CsgD family transcriptional regulator
MSPSRRLRLGEVRRVFRLVAEIREVGPEPQVWRSHLLESLDQLIGMNLGVVGECVYPAGEPHVLRASLCVRGAGDWGALPAFLTSAEIEACPGFQTLCAWRRRSLSWNSTADSAMADIDGNHWAASRLQAARSQAGLDGMLYSQRRLPGVQASHIIALNRGFGERPFTDAQTDLLWLLHAELARVWCLADDNPRWSLPPRVRQTLQGLLNGQSEKQIARTLGLSHHTVHNYVKQLHCRFEVETNGELLARCAADARSEWFPRLSLRPDAMAVPVAAGRMTRHSPPEAVSFDVCRLEERVAPAAVSWMFGITSA